MPIAIIVAEANRPDFRLFKDTLDAIALKRPRPTPKRPQGLCLDKGYEYAEVILTTRRRHYELHLRRKGEPARHRPKVGKARRWVVERTHSWFNRYRSLLVRWEKETENYEAMLHIAAAIIAYKRSK